MAELGRIGDPRCADALALLESKRLPDGGFPLEDRNARTSATIASRCSFADWGPAGTRRSNPSSAFSRWACCRQLGGAHPAPSSGPCRGPSVPALGVAVDAVLGHGRASRRSGAMGFPHVGTGRTFRRRRVARRSRSGPDAAVLAPEAAGRAALGDFGGGRGLRAVGLPRVLDLLGELQPDSRALRLQRLPCVLDQLRVHWGILAAR